MKSKEEKGEKKDRDEREGKRKENMGRGGSRGLSEAVLKMMSTFAYAESRFMYSSIPCFKYFSFSFPIATIDIFTGHPHFKNKLFRSIIHNCG